MVGLVKLIMVSLRSCNKKSQLQLTAITWHPSVLDHPSNCAAAPKPGGTSEVEAMGLVGLGLVKRWGR